MQPLISKPATRAALFGASAAAVYLTMLTVTLPHLEAVSGHVPFDMRPAGYGPEEARALLTALGREGRSYYVTRQILLDTFYPALLALTLANLFRLLGSHGVQGRLAGAGIVVSWMAAGFDYAENAGIYAMLSLWDTLPDGLVYLTAVASVSKSACTSLALVGLAGLWVSKWWTRRSKVAGELS